MNVDEFKKEIEKLGIIYNEEMLEKLKIYKNFLIEYNTHTNLTRIVNEEDIYLKKEKKELSFFEKLKKWVGIND